RSGRSLLVWASCCDRDCARTRPEGSRLSGADVARLASEMREASFVNRWAVYLRANVSDREHLERNSLVPPRPGPPAELLTQTMGRAPRLWTSPLSRRSGAHGTVARLAIYEPAHTPV